ncbi:ribosome silencing factor [Pseudonocardia phyllosphaerae]|uniref:ribosome silencing factor n=1 Tax=Pseudonocardia phyllosphaerae TaxID=3390502 RepID=UPI00397DDD26
MTASSEAIEMTKVAAAAAADKKAADIVALDVSEQMALTDCFVLASAQNERQVQAIVDAVEEKLRERGHKPTRREGDADNGWVLLDFNDIVVHVMHTEQRGFYGLDRLWKDCPTIAVPDDAPPPEPDAVPGGDA